jgi:hypothetical protein
MTKTEYTKLKAEIVKQYGQPVYELNQAINESARKLVEVKLAYLKEKHEVEKTRQLIKDVKQIAIPTESDFIAVPEELLKESWLSPFDEGQRQLIRLWLSDISQTAKALAEATGQDIKAVRATMSSEAFKLLRGHLALAYKGLLPLEASAALRGLLKCKTENVVLQAAKLVLIDAGLYKGESLDITNNKPKEVLLDAATEEKLRKLGNELLND